MGGVSSIQDFFGFFLTLQSPLGVIQNFHHFHNRTQHTLGGGHGRRTLITKCRIHMVHCDFENVSNLNQHFQSTLMVGREVVTQKSTLCTLLIILTIFDDPL